MKLWRQFGLHRVVTDYFATRRAQRSTQYSISSSIFFRRSKKTADDGTPIGIDFSTFEYVIERKILEAPTLELTYYVDVVGEIPSQLIPTRYAGDGIDGINNGDTSPEWGFDLVIYDGFLRYGPWADRQRYEAFLCNANWKYNKFSIERSCSALSFPPHIVTWKLPPLSNLVINERGRHCRCS